MFKSMRGALLALAALTFCHPAHASYVGSNPLVRTDPTGLRCNGQGCWNTPEERGYAQSGDWKNYYATACAGGDPYACEGGNVANNVGMLSGVTNYRLASSISSRLPPGKTCAADQALISQNMEAIREALVAARAAQLDAAGATPDNPVMVTAQSISDFHNQVFQANGAGPVFGGDIPGANALLMLSNMGNGGYGWCSSPACH